MEGERIDFVGIGAPKSGTTWISECLAEHPDVGFAPDKEVYYFADSEARSYANAGFDNYQRGVSWYHLQMPDKPGAKVFGEYSVSYMYDPRACDRIYEYHPGIKILIALRNPVDMVYSWYWYNRTGLIANLPETFSETMKLDYFRDLGLYYRALAPFFDRFPREQIHIVLHDDIKRNADAVLRGLFSFLGVDEYYVPLKSKEKVNVAKETRFRWLQRMGGTTYDTLRKVPAVSTIVSSRPFEKAVLSVYRCINHVQAEYPPIDSEMRAELTAYYYDDIIKLADLVDDDLSAWLTHDR